MIRSTHGFNFGANARMWCGCNPFVEPKEMSTTPTFGNSIPLSQDSSTFIFLVWQVLLCAIENARQATLERLMGTRQPRQFHPPDQFTKRHTSQRQLSSERLSVFGFQTKPSHRLSLRSGCLPRLASGKTDGNRSKMLSSVAGMRTPNTPGVCEPCFAVRRPCLRAAGYDQFHPISKKGSMMSPKGLGWIIVDSLGTMMIMNLTSQLSDQLLPY